jgi:hypothetical protein
VGTRGWVALLWVLGSGPAFGAAPGVQLPDTALGRELAPGLMEELGPGQVVMAPGEAQLVVRLTEVEGALGLEVLDATGAPILERRIGLEGGRPAAWRKVVFAVAGATRAAPALTPIATSSAGAGPVAAAADPPGPAPGAEPGAEPARAPEGPPTLSLGLGPHVPWMGGAPQLGLSVLLARPVGPLRVGVHGAVAGICCAATSGADDGQVALRGEATVWSVAARGAWPALALGPVSLGPTLEVGVEQLRLRVTPEIFAGPATTTATTRTGLVARAGAALRGRVAGRLGWRVDAALQLRSAAPQVSLPAGFPRAAAPLRVGRWGPVLAAGLEVDFF